MTPLRVVFDTNVFSPQHFDFIDNSPMRKLCRGGRIDPIYSGQFFDEMARAYMSNSKRDHLLERWLPFIIETATRFHEGVPCIWHRELVQGAGRKVSTFMKPSLQREVISRMQALPPDGSWPFVKETEKERQAETDRLVAQRELSKEMRAEVSSLLKVLGRRGAPHDVGQDLKRRLMPLIGRGMIQQHIAGGNWRTVAARWERNPSSYRYFTQFVDNMIYKEKLFILDPSVPIDVNAQPDLDLMTFLIDADAFVTNETKFAQRAFADIWRPRGKVLFTSEEFARLMNCM